MADRLQRFVNMQRGWCEAIERRFVSGNLQLEGNRCFVESYARSRVKEKMVIYDVGGGKTPFLSAEEKKDLGLTVFGLDIDPHELNSAPNGSYDQIVCADICGYSGKADADLVISEAVLEHVIDLEAAIDSIASMLKPGAAAVVFIPCRNAWYARLNMLLPHSWKRRLLFTLYPDAELRQGFPAYYDRCTPREVASLARRSGLVVEHIATYHKSFYFHFFFPLYVLWRTWAVMARVAFGEQMCESFSMVLRKAEDLRSEGA